MEEMQIYERLATMVLDGDEINAIKVAREAIEKGLSPLDCIEKGLVKGIRRAGELWEEGEFFLPELVTSAQAMKSAMQVFAPYLKATERIHTAKKVVIGTVEGDIHDIGKTLVATMLSVSGFEVYDEGADVPLERFILRAKEVDADIIALSALLTTTMLKQKDVVDARNKEGLRAKIMVGGAPVTRDWARQIGADGFADNAIEAVNVAKLLVEL